MATNKRDLKAFVRFDGTGRVVPSSVILQRNKPKVGNWKQINAYECCNPTTTYEIGQAALGGIIAYILQPGDPGYDANVQHGLVTTTDNTSDTVWGCIGTLISGANGQAIGTGLQNSLDIVAECPDPFCAAKICLDLNEGGYTDWYLPSRNELLKLYENRVAIGGFLTNRYWSSSQFDANNGWFVNFLNGTQGGTQKDTSRTVRAVRSF